MGNKVFLDELPRRGKTNQINWEKSVGKKINFIYDNIKGELKIVNYDSKNSYLYLKYLDEENFRINIGNLKKCKIAKLLNKRNGEFKIEIGTRYKDNKRDITIIDRTYKIRNSKSGTIKEKYYKYRCNKCGYECGEHYKNGKYEKEHWVQESNLLLHGISCSCCCTPSQIVVPGINDIPTTAPWMIKYFQGGYDEAKKYTYSSGQKIFPICPDCKRIKDKPITISNIYKRKSIGCKECGDGISYPEKLMFNILEQFKIKFETEKYFKWCKFIINNKNKIGRYDFYFELNNKKYIIEMDGNFHNTDNPMNGQTKEESKIIDDIKDKLADEYNIKVIRIDCQESKLKYIKNKILESKLNNIFNLGKINWSKVEEFALSNLVKKACEIKKDNPDITAKNIGEIIKLNKITVIRYLKKGNKLKWCNYDPKIEIEKNNKNTDKYIKI